MTDIFVTNNDVSIFIFSFGKGNVLNQISTENLRVFKFAFVTYDLFTFKN